MNKIKYVILFVIAFIIISFIVLSILGIGTANNTQVAYIEQIKTHFSVNKGYVQEKDVSITNRELYFNYDEDNFDNNNELLESTSIYYWDTDQDGVPDDKEIDNNTNPLKNNTFNGVHDGVKVYYFGSDRLDASSLPKENFKISDSDSGVEITNIDINSQTNGIVVKETGAYIDKNAEVAFLVKSVNAGASISLQTNTKETLVVAINQLFTEKKSVEFVKEGNRITFTHNGSDLIYIVGEKNKIEELIDKKFIVFKSNIPLFKKFYIYEKTSNLTSEEMPELTPENIKVPDNLKLKTKKLSLFSGLIYEGLGNNFYGDITRNSMLVEKTYNTSLYELKKELNLVEDTFVQKNAFNIDNFSTSLIRNNVSGGLAYCLTLFNKEIKSGGKHTWDTQSSVGLITEYDFKRDLNGYKSILNNNFGEYRFSTKVTERQDLDTTSNPDLQVFKFIEMYSDVFEKNKKKYLIENKYSVDNISIIETNINNENLPVFGIKTGNGGIYLTGYKIEKSEFSDNVYKVYVYDSNFKQNKVGDKNVSENLVLYLIKSPQWKITDKNQKEMFYSLEYYYSPFNMGDYSFNNIDNRKSDLDIFIF